MNTCTFTPLHKYFSCPNGRYVLLVLSNNRKILNILKYIFYLVNSSLFKNSLLKKSNRKCNGCNGFNGNCIGFTGNYNGVYWYVMDSIGGVLNPIGKMPKTQQK